ncbi:MAG: diaminopimelate epimerase [bacterium]
MKLTFYKAQGIGNDFVIIDLDGQEVNLKAKDYRLLADRHFGIGADQIILISADHGNSVRFINADGSEAEMCGNGIRCAAAYLWEIKGRPEEPLKIDTMAGVKLVSRQDGLIQVDMGKPVLEGKEIPVRAEGQVRDYPLEVGGETYRITAVSMGNPHCVVFGPENALNMSELGPLFEVHPFFPNRTNLEYVTLVNENCLKVEVWERGTGITLACGTGACASVVAACLNGLTGSRVKVDLPGGSLHIEWNRQSDRILLAGPAEIVYKGKIK